MAFRKPPSKPARDPNEFASFVPRVGPPTARMAITIDGVSRADLQAHADEVRRLIESELGPMSAPRGVPPKIDKRVRKRSDIRDSARGEECAIRLPGCDGGGETTVWCHLPEAVAGRGMGLKGIDILGAYGCRNCHDIVDRRAPRPGRMTEHDVALAFYRALARSVVKLAQKGLL